MDQYKPQGTKAKVDVTIGFNVEDRWAQGVNIYNKGRLIKRWHGLEKIHVNNTGSQFLGVVAVVEASHLEPLQTKQDFANSPEYFKVLSWVREKIQLYKKQQYIEIAHGGEGAGHFWSSLGFPTIGRESRKKELKFGSQAWIRCPGCKKYRSVPKGTDPDSYDDDWRCGRCNTHQTNDFPDEVKIHTVPRVVKPAQPKKRKREEATKKGPAKKAKATKKGPAKKAKATKKAPPKKKKVTEGDLLKQVHEKIINFEDRTPWEVVDPQMWTERERNGMINAGTVKEYKISMMRLEASVVEDAQVDSWGKGRETWIEHLRTAATAADLKPCVQMLKSSMKWYQDEVAAGGDGSDDDDDNDEEEEDEEESSEEEEDEEESSEDEDLTVRAQSTAAKKPKTSPTPASSSAPERRVSTDSGTVARRSSPSNGPPRIHQSAPADSSAFNEVAKQVDHWRDLYQQQVEKARLLEEYSKEQESEVKQLRSEVDYLRKKLKEQVNPSNTALPLSEGGAVVEANVAEPLPHTQPAAPAVITGWRKIRIKVRLSGTDGLWREILLKTPSFQHLCEQVESKLEIKVQTIEVYTSNVNVPIQTDADVTGLQQQDQLVIIPVSTIKSEHILTDSAPQ